MWSTWGKLEVVKRFGVLVMCVACQVPDVDLTGKQCPCPESWTCDPTTNTCGRGDAGTRDAPGDSTDASTLDQGLLFWFKLDELTGTTFADASGNGYDGTTMNPPHTMWDPDGKINGALHFDGSGYASVVCPPDNTLTQAFTVATWVSFDSFGTAPFTLSDFAIVEGTGGGTEGGWGIGATDQCGGHTLGLELASSVTGTTRTIRCSATTIQIKTWYQLTAVYDGAAGRADLYVDGVLANGTVLGTVPAMTFQPPACPYLGVASNQANHLTGLLDEVRVYARALAPSEVLAVYHASGG